MFTIEHSNGYKYVCEDELSLKEELLKRGFKPTYLKESWVPSDTVMIVASGLIWYINGKVLDKIIEELPKLFKKK